jgi:radical SAM protein with 4Fe4S-binding SPASM domain
LNLTFSGGEILVRRDLFEIAEYAHSKRFLLRLFTNGTLVKPAVADRIAALHPYAVEISIYGVDAETHETITRLPRSFELSIWALRLLHERGVRTVLKTPLMHHNVGQYHALKALAEELGAQFRHSVTITPKDTGGLDPLQHRMTDDDLLGLFRETIEPGYWEKRNLPPDARTCGITLNAFDLDPYGNVFPCVQTRIAAGNVREQSLQVIWKESPLWMELGNLTLSELPVCGTCELRSLCVRCHGLAHVEDGDLRGPASVNCREALVRRQVLIEKGALPADYPIPAHLQTPVWWLVPVQDLA